MYISVEDRGYWPEGMQQLVLIQATGQGAKRVRRLSLMMVDAIHVEFRKVHNLCSLDIVLIKAEVLGAEEEVSWPAQSKTVLGAHDDLEPGQW